MDELAERRERLLAKIALPCAVFHNGGDGLGKSSFEYFSGCSIEGAYLALRKGKGKLLVREMDYREAKAASHYPVTLLGKDAPKQLRTACKGRAGACLSEMSASRYAALGKMAKIRLVDITDAVMAVRSRKSRQEMKIMAGAAKISKGILERLDPWEFSTEEELMRHLHILALKNGCKLAYEPIVATGRNSSCPHHKPGKARLLGMVLVDFGVKWQGYCTDFTNCYFRKSGTAEERAYGKCARIFDAIAERLDGCKTGRDAALISERLIKEAGLPRLIHSIGHGVGRDVHEYPRLGAKSQDSLDGAVVALEPAAYFAKFGVRYERMIANAGGQWELL